MNKLFIDNSINIEDIVIDQDLDLKIDFKDEKKNLTINVLPNVCLRVFDTSNNTKNSITYNISENTQVIINKFSIDCSDEITLNINKENAKITFNTSLINYSDNTYRQTVNHNCMNSESKIKNHALNILDNELKLVVNGIVKKNSKNTIFRQDNKIINLKDGNSFIFPNLIVDNHDIEASHSAYIGKFDEDVIFYLMTRGLTRKDANSLLIKAFLINNMSLEENEIAILDAVVKNV